ncbi:unnamed protein product [Brachionus calyciflorus]|uniref:CCHC-type domain-containing protein n=1 Tax=Brachionus calyciflorus TaxID=104777 RepID=A0A814BYC1_9BILA|nr:unnamed protein product [Brachionus calyciflorus]
MTQLYDRKQSSESEMKRRFYERVQLPSEGAYLFATQLRDQFIRGLNDKYLRTRLQVNKDDHTLEEIIHEAVKYERAYSDVNELRTQRDERVQKIEQESNQSRSDNNYINNPPINNFIYQQTNGKHKSPPQRSYQQNHNYQTSLQRPANANQESYHINNQQKKQHQQIETGYIGKEIKFYKCNNAGHIARDCPDLLKTAVNNINTQPTEMHGICHINGTDVLFLADTGARNSCVSERISRKLNLFTTHNPINVYNPVGGTIKTLGRTECDLSINNINVILKASIIEDMLATWTTSTYENMKLANFLRSGYFGKTKLLEYKKYPMPKLEKETREETESIVKEINPRK